MVFGSPSVVRVLGVICKRHLNRQQRPIMATGQAVDACRKVCQRFA